jgi:hypothetical protein
LNGLPSVPVDRAEADMFEPRFLDQAEQPGGAVDLFEVQRLALVDDIEHPLRRGAERLVIRSSIVARSVV